MLDANKFCPPILSQNLGTEKSTNGNSHAQKELLVGILGAPELRCWDATFGPSKQPRSLIR